MVATASTASQYSRTRALDLCYYLAATLCAIFLIPSCAELQRIEHPIKSDGSLSFLVVGDWGRRGLYNQSKVAFQVQLLLHQDCFFLFLCWLARTPI